MPTLITGAVIGGAVTIGIMAVGDYMNGDVSDWQKYFYKGMASAVSGAVCAALGPNPTMSLGKYIFESIKAGGAGGFFGTLTEFFANGIYHSYDITLADFFANTLMGGAAGGLTAWFSYIFLGASSSSMANSLSKSKSSGKPYLREMMRKYGMYDKEIYKYVKNIFPKLNINNINDAMDAVLNNPNKFLKGLVDNIPEKFLKNATYFFNSREVPDLIKLILLNTVRETAISGISGTKVLEAIQKTDWYKKISEKINSYVQSDLENYLIEVLNISNKELEELITCY